MSPVISNRNPLILASDSPRRRLLLEQLQIPFRQLSSNADEKESSGDPVRDASLIAKAKALAVQALEPSSWILGADTMVVLGRDVMGKPADEREAREMLRSLSGNTHTVITGFCILSSEGVKAHTESVLTEVRFRKLKIAEIDAYIETGEPFGKAGAYAIQGIGAFMVQAINGSYTNVVGLPLCALVKAFLEIGAISRYPLAQSKRA